MSSLKGRLETRVAIKTGIAAAISLNLGVGVATLMGRPNSLLSGTWCVLSTFVVLQAHLGGTYRAAWIRFLGVLIGSVMGAFFTTVLGSNSIVLGISVTLTILICSLFNIKESIRIACLSVSIVMILWGLNPTLSPWEFGFYRFMDSALGILVALAVARTIFPAQATQKLRHLMGRTLLSQSKLLEYISTSTSPPEQYKRTFKRFNQTIDNFLVQNRQVFGETQLELLTKTKNLQDWENLIDNLANIFDSINALNVYHDFKLGRIVDKDLLNQLNATIEQVIQAMTEIASSVQSDKNSENRIDLQKVKADLNEELSRFRTTRTTHKFEREEVEHFFVFFYNIRAVIEELLKIRETIATLNEQSDS